MAAPERIHGCPGPRVVALTIRLLGHEEVIERTPEEQRQRILVVCGKQARSGWLGRLGEHTERQCRYSQTPHTTIIWMLAPLTVAFCLRRTAAECPRWSAVICRLSPLGVVLRQRLHAVLVLLRKRYRRHRRGLAERPNRRPFRDR